MPMPAEGWPETPEPLAAPVIDTHTHLDVHDRHLHGDAKPDPDELLARAREVNVTKVVQIGCDVESAEWSVAMAQDHPDVVVGVALHPNDAARIVERQGRPALERAWERIDELARDPTVRAVGETGLDYYRTRDDEGHSAQQESFRWHIALAKELDKTLVNHDRDSHEDVIRLLVDAGPPRTVVFHCFSGDAAMARICAQNGWYMSFAGVVTYKNAQDLRDALAEVPDNLLLVETDAPYLTPVPHRGRVNATYLMPHTVRALAQERDTDEARMATLLYDNAQRAFGAW
jgi:TatD DNase family protein